MNDTTVKIGDPSIAEEPTPVRHRIAHLRMRVREYREEILKARYDMSPQMQIMRAKAVKISVNGTITTLRGRDRIEELFDQAERLFANAAGNRHGGVNDAPR